VKPNQHPHETIVPVHRKIAGSAEHHQDNDERECSDQVVKKDGTAKRRTENDLAAAAFFSRMCLFDP
jgi:hypothetical protein